MSPFNSFRVLLLATVLPSVFGLRDILEISIGGPDVQFNTTPYQAAEANPFSTKSVSFTFDQGTNWTWRVNVSNTNTGKANVPNPNTYITTYDLQWPGGGDFSNALVALQHANDQKFCVSVVSTFFAANVTNAFDESQDGSCISALGRECMNEIVNTVIQTVDEDCGTDFPISSPACRGSFPTTDFQISSTAISPNISSYVYNGSNITTYPPQSGQGLAYIYSDTFSGLNNTYQDQEEDRLHMNLFFDTTNAVALCTRINPSTKAKDESTGAAPSAATALTIPSSVGIWVLSAAAMFAAMTLW